MWQVTARSWNPTTPQWKKLPKLRRPKHNNNLEVDIERDFVDKGILVHTVLAWYQQALDQTIAKRPHASTCTPKITTFIRREMSQQMQDGFSILLPAAEIVRVFWDKLKLSCIADIPQDYFHPRLIINLLAKTNEGMPSVNNTTYRDVSLESMKFGRALPRILQEIFGADPDSPRW